MNANEGRSKDDTIKLYLCPYCKKLFSSKHELGKHILRECPKKNHSPDRPPDES